MKAKDYTGVAVGLVCLSAGLILLKLLPEGILKPLPYVLVGIGCGVFGQGAGMLLRKSAVKNCPEIEKQMEIEAGDERNVAISNRAKAKAYDVMVVVFGALMLCFALMDVGLPAILLLVFAYLFVIGCGVYARCRYDREM